MVLGSEGVVGWKAFISGGSLEKREPLLSQLSSHTLCTTLLTAQPLTEPWPREQTVRAASHLPKHVLPFCLHSVAWLNEA